jgi:16S rRNA (cytosine1402-N4)-methyltransferase
MSSSHEYHLPVLLDEILSLFLHTTTGVFVDGTLGGGGHFRAMAERLDANSTLIGIDRDPEAIRWNLDRLPESQARIVLEKSPFSAFDRVLQAYHIDAVDGILLDLGVSSRQIDAPVRGFSYMQDAELDMRMDPTAGIPAHELIARSSDQELSAILQEYGEVRDAPRLARSLKRWCERNELKRSGDLRKWCAETFKGAVSVDLLARMYQSFRIAVNDELGELKRFLDKVIDFLKPGARLAVISYHSLEDRQVKTFMQANERTCICPPELPRCQCNERPRLRRLTRKAIRPGNDEIGRNRRARSARLRIAEKVGRAG